MSEYIKQTWVDGETLVDAEHLNHLEEGVAAAHKAIAELPEIPEIPDVPVQSVNGKTGDVTLTASDVDALPADAEIIDTTARAGVAALSEEIDALGGATLSAAQIASCKEFASLFAGTEGDADAFIFFTDPHTIAVAENADVRPEFAESLNQIAAVYNSIPATACVCGGDWLNNRNSVDNACWLLGKIDGAMKDRFGQYILLVGNHDTNYQGYDYIIGGEDRTESEKCKLSNAAIRNLWHRGREHSYFVEKIDSGTYYVFDTGLDWSPEMDEYRLEQIDWFAKRLQEDDAANSAGLLHIVKTSGAVSPFAENIATVARAYNNRSVVVMNGKEYDFSSMKGTFRFIVAGHTHKDETLNVKDIPVVITKNLLAIEGVYSFDLMLADYAADTLHMVRVGDGQSRNVAMAKSTAASSNMFVYGTADSYNSFTYHQDVDPNFIVGADYIQNIDAGGGSSINYKDDMYPCVSHKTFRLSANYAAVDAGKTANAVCFVKIYDASGTIIGRLAVDGWQYVDAYKASMYNGGVGRLDVTFTLPDDASSFQIGFRFDLVEDNDGSVRISDIVLEKA